MSCNVCISILRLLRPTLGFLVLALLTACATSTYTPSTDANRSIQAIGNAIGAVRAENPSTAGLQDYAEITRNAFSGRTDEDINLLVGRIYLDAASKLQQSSYAYAADTERIHADVQRALAERRPVSKLSRTYFDDLLSDTKRRIAADARYHCAVATSAQAARYTWNPAWDNYKCIVDGQPMPIGVCRSLVICGTIESLTIS